MVENNIAIGMSHQIPIFLIVLCSTILNETLGSSKMLYKRFESKLSKSYSVRHYLIYTIIKNRQRQIESKKLPKQEKKKLKQDEKMQKHRIQLQARLVYKVGCVFPMIIVPILLNAEFGGNDHR